MFSLTDNLLAGLASMVYVVCRAYVFMTKMSQKELFEKAYVLIKCKANLEPYVLERLERISGVHKVEYTAGTGCMLLGIMAYTLEGLQDTICSKIQKIPQIYSTSIIICGQTCMKESEIYE